MNPDVFVGIDPGKDGAIAVLLPNTSPILYPMPIVEVKDKWEIDSRLLYETINGLAEYGTRFCIEEVQGNPRFGTKNFSFGRNFGSILAVLEILMVSYVRVKPQKWQRSMLPKGVPTKKASVEHVQKLYPKLSLIPPGDKKPSHDWADAVCLALYIKGEISNG